MISDHEIIETKFKLDDGENKKIVFSRNFSEGKIRGIALHLLEQDWNYTSNVNVLYENLMMNIEKVVDKISPLQVKCVERVNEEWIDTEVKQAQKLRDEYYKVFKYTSNIKYFEKYRQGRNSIISMIRRKEKE
ncbi:hypothetical protein HHI36_016470 [Cryptolaemus montrouzieri]|uniref:Uncharacterized protein n=1 Tax=Cryptolaemus montrouzieri TaxID=559131 RepID=A0ABD2NKL5_9CUCU